ncbi:lipase [Streptomyces sp. NPDC004610]|uniref:alpha/beta hydrolase family protein n=1 Tax=unclassified Streptomyces TaxID=2593676 RepID=UPI0033A189E2
MTNHQPGDGPSSRPWTRRAVLAATGTMAATTALAAATPATATATATATTTASATPTTPAPPLRLTLPAPTGRHPIGTHTLRLVDRSRRDPWVPSRPVREFMAQIWYPAAHPPGRTRAPWMTPAAARHFQASGVLPAGYVTLPDSHAGTDLPARTLGGARPVILYSHGHGQHRTSGLSLVEDLAAHGYVVITLDHTYDAGQVEFPGGRVETYGMPELTPELPPEEERRIVERALRVRVADVRHTLATLTRAVRDGDPALPSGLRRIMDLSRTAMFGHSLGGATAAEVMCQGLPVLAGANLDGALFGDVLTHGLDRPLLLLGADEPDPRSWLDTWPRLRSWRRFLRLTGSAHFSFTDYTPLLPQAAPRIGASPELVAALIGTLDAPRSLAVQRELLLAFFDLHLRGRGAPVLEGPRGDMPEVEFRKEAGS